MSGPTVVITAPRACEALEVYRQALQPPRWRLVPHPAVERHGEESLLQVIADADALVCGDDRVTARVLGAAPRLKVIVKWGTGLDSIDRDAARKGGVEVCNTPDAFSDPVADTVFGYLLLFARKLDAMSADMHAGHWRRIQLTSLHEQTLGIIGFGHIGQAVARRASAFRMSVLANDIRDIETAASGLGARVTRLEELLTLSDYVTLHADSRPENRHLLDDRHLRLMRASAVLVNTARGALVDEVALTRALASGQIGGAALDVFDDEPLSRSSELRRLPNVYLAPHNSNSSPSAADRVHANTIRQLVRVFGAPQS
jgi:D-3-phosphoglycerate dehydrogenase